MRARSALMSKRDTVTDAERFSPAGRPRVGQRMSLAWLLFVSPAHRREAAAAELLLLGLPQLPGTERFPPRSPDERGFVARCTRRSVVVAGGAGRGGGV